MKTGFEQRHSHDRIFWPVFVVLAWMLVVIGFSHTVELRFTGKSDFPAPPILVLHVWSFAAWLVLISVQLLLSRSGLISMHRQLGWTALVLVPIMVVSAIGAEIHGERFYVTRYDDVIRFFPIPVFSMISFAVCAFSAIAMRRDRAAHMRLIYLATSSVLVATFFRWWGDTIYDAMPAGFWTEWIANYIGVALLMSFAIAYDLATRGGVHKVLRIAVPLILAGQLVTVAIGQSDWWPPFGEHLIGLDKVRAASEV